MPMIIEGGSRCRGDWWARHLEDVEKNERAQLVSVEGLSADTVPELFREMRGMALGSKVKNYFYQANINPRADERLTPAQQREAVATLGRNLGLEGQPHFVIEHEKNGRVHQHVVWLRVDLATMKAIPDSLTARIHEQTSRELEIKFDLQRGRSILVPDRAFARPERLAKKHERFRGTQSGLDTRTVAADLKALRERSDGAQSFRAGMEAAGYVLARGDRRDFVVIDSAGDEHSLARRLGVKAAELRVFMKGIDLTRLPSVAEARTHQKRRQVAPAAHQPHERAGEGGEASVENAPPDGAQKSQNARAKSKPKLSATQAAIRTAWSQGPGQLMAALDLQGIGLARVTAAEAHDNHRRRAFAKQIGRYVQPLREGEIVAINEKGHVYRLSPRNVGVTRAEIAQHLAGIEVGSLASISETKEIMRARGRAKWIATRRDERDQARPASRIEQRIAACQAEAGRIDPSNRMSGAEALANALDAAGIAVVRVTAADLQSLKTLRADQKRDREVEWANDARQPPFDQLRVAERLTGLYSRFPYYAEVAAGDIAAVDRAGNLHRLNPHRLDLAQLTAELGVAARLEGLSNTDLLSATAAQTRFATEREAIAASREEMAERRLNRSLSSASEPLAGRGNDDLGLRSVGDAASRVAKGLEAAASAVLNFFSDSIAPPPPPSAEQMRQQNEAAKATQAANGVRQETDQRLAQTLDMIRAARKQRDQEDEQQRQQRTREQQQELRRDR